MKGAARISWQLLCCAVNQWQQDEQAAQPQPKPWQRRQSRLRLTRVTTVGAQLQVRVTQRPQTGPVSVVIYSLGVEKISSIWY